MDKKSPIREWFVFLGGALSLVGFFTYTNRVGAGALVLGLVLLNAGLIGLAVRSGD